MTVVINVVKTNVFVNVFLKSFLGYSTTKCFFLKTSIIKWRPFEIVVKPNENAFENVQPFTVLILL